MAVDMMAVQAARKGCYSKAEVDTFKLNRQRQKQHLQGVAAILQSWPPEKWSCPTRSSKNKNSQEGQAHNPFWFVMFKQWQCSHCSRWAATVESLNRKTCRPSGSHLIGHARQSQMQGHLLYLAQVQGGHDCLIYCAKCGCYAHRRWRRLFARCSGRTSQTKVQLQKILQGKHPAQQGWFLSKPSRLSTVPPPAPAEAEEGEHKALQSQRAAPAWEMEFDPPALGQLDSLWNLEEGQHDKALPSQMADWEGTGAEDEWDLNQQDLWFGPEQQGTWPGNQTPRLDAAFSDGVEELDLDDGNCFSGHHAALQAGKG